MRSSINDIPLSTWRSRVAAKPWASAALAIGATLLAIGARLLIAPWIGASGLVMFLPVIVIVAYMAGPRWGYLSLVLTTILIWFLVLRSSFGAALPPQAQRTDLIVLIVASVGAIEFVRLLDKAINSLQQERRRSAALAEQRQTLMHELAHRTSNNFQMVSGVLSMARRTVDDPTAKKALSEAAERVAAMGAVQRQLATDVGNGIELGAFLPILCASLEKGLGVKVICTPDSVGPVSSRTASSLALIVQEFVANAAEHGVKDDLPLTVEVRVESRGPARAALIVEDDGQGVPPGFDPHAATSMGLNLVTAFVAGLDGTFDIRNRSDNPGAIATAEFSLNDPAPVGQDG